ncbi:hypothetical protein V6X02_04270 [Spiribacter sp. 1M153]|uniref:hypothetical protein n=1 Tax=Spiribacter roseus TaxID=1855875 RepID=UPI00349F1044
MLLLVVIFLDHFTSLGDYTSAEPRAWEAFDPDLEVMPRDDEGRVLSVESLAQSPELLEEYHGGHEEDEAWIVEIFGSRENNTYMSHQPGAWFEWKSPVLDWFERLAEWLKFVAPVVLIALGAWVLLGLVRADHRRIRKT